MAESKRVTSAARSSTTAGDIRVAEFTEAVFNGVLRALDAREKGQSVAPLRGHIIIGIIYDPAATLRTERQ